MENPLELAFDQGRVRPWVMVLLEVAQEQSLEILSVQASVQEQVQPSVLVLLGEAQEQSLEIPLELAFAQVRVQLMGLEVFEQKLVPVSGSLSVSLLELVSVYV